MVYPREELEAMMTRWQNANHCAEETNDWRSNLGPFYSDQAIYRWNVGPEQSFSATGRREIEEIALGVQMEGFEGWRYPYQRTVIDPDKGEIVAFWRQIAPAIRPDGSCYEVAGTGGSWFRYGGHGKWAEQEDFFDFGNVLALLKELAADGKLDPIVKKKIHDVAWGKPLPGQRLVGQSSGRLARKVTCEMAMARIALFGR